MKLHELADRPGARKNRSRIGRGIGSGTGKTGGRGGKGQTARSGVRIKGFEGGQMPLHRRLPKRGFKNVAFARKLNEVNLERVQAAIDAGKLDAGSTVDAAALVKAEELKKRIWFTLGALLVYRFGTYIPLPGIDPSAWDQIFKSQAGGILGMFNMFSGGGIHRMAIFALNIMPYISASIIIQLMTTVSPTLEQLKKEGEQGRKTINQYTRYLTVILAAAQAYGISIGLEGAGNAVSDPGLFFRLSTAITLTGGTMFLMWLGEQITSRGIGNGISLIILSGIVAELPSALFGMFELGRQGALSTGLILIVIVMAIAVIAFIVFMERAQRRLLIQYPKRQ